MRQLIQNMKSGQLTIEEMPEPLLTERSVLVRNVFSVISAGTEKSKIDLGKKNLLQKALARPDLVKQVWKKLKTEGLAKTYHTVNAKLEMPSPLGYSAAGIVEEVGVYVEGIMPGDRVACGGAGYANHAEFIVVPANLVVKIPDNVSLEEASFTTIGSIALQGARLAQPLLGELFLVLGLGLIGQIASQILMANGCQVLAYDPDPSKRKLAQEFGCIVAENETQLQALADSHTHHHGLDGALICAATSSNGPIELCAEILRSKARVVIVGVVGMNIPREPYFKKEISVVISRSYGPGRYDPHYEEGGLDYPYDYVRFTEKRNMESFLDLVSANKIQLKPLITHRFKFSQAIEAYDVLEKPAEHRFLGIVLAYEELSKKEKPTQLKQSLEKVPGKINISFLGCGNYAMSNVLPVLNAHANVKLQCVLSASGRTAENVAKKFGFAASVNQVEEVFSQNTDVVFIMTRHHNHAELTSQALEAGKHVFVEKPLAISLLQFEEVKEVLARYSQAHFLIGFNRRFSPLTQEVNKFFSSTRNPKMINIRVNAGRLPADSWILQTEIGGGRIVGELCHFVDLASALCASAPIKVMATCVPDSSKSVLLQDNVQVTLQMMDGSVANIIYTSDGSTTMPKEYIEVFCGGRSAVIDDFRQAHLFSEKTKKTIKLSKQDKGQQAMLNQFLQSLSENTPLVERETLLANSLATLLIVESLVTAKAISVYC